MANFKIMISAGEISGDMHAAQLVREIKQINPEVELFGMGGVKMMEAGVDVRANLTERGTVGIFEVLVHLPIILRTLKRMKKALKIERPDLLLLVDYQGFNMILAQEAKKLGIKTAYYIAPQEWLWGTKKNLLKVSQTLDLIVAIFKREAEIYHQAGAHVCYFGNPLIDIVKPRMEKKEDYKWFRLDEKIPIVALLAGSRRQEIRKLLPLALKAAKILSQKKREIQFILPLSSPVFRHEIEEKIKAEKIEVQVVDGYNYDVLNIADIALAVSGTVTLEAAILNTPTVVFYKLSAITYFIAKHILKLKVPYISLPNIIAEKMILPELIQDEATPENIAESVLEILENKEIKDKMIGELQKVKESLGDLGVVRRAAEKILEA